MIKTLDEPVELMSDPDMIMLCEQNIRGGVSFVGERHAESPMKKEHETIEDFENTPQDTLLYIDANNLYSLAQSDYMPTGNYSWCTEEENDWFLDNENVLSIPKDSRTGFILEVDLEYPAEIHAQHNTLPLAAELFLFFRMSHETERANPSQQILLLEVMY